MKCTELHDFSSKRVSASLSWKYYFISSSVFLHCDNITDVFWCWIRVDQHESLVHFAFFPKILCCTCKMLIYFACKISLCCKDIYISLCHPGCYIDSTRFMPSWAMLLLGFKGVQLVNEAPTGRRKAEVSACVFRMVTSAFVFSLLKIIFS